MNEIFTERQIRYIIVDKYNRPMSFDGEQVWYCDSSKWKGRKLPVKLVTKQEAQKQIRMTKKFRKQFNDYSSEYYLMKVEE